MRYCYHSTNVVPAIEETRLTIRRPKLDRSITLPSIKTPAHVAASTGTFSLRVHPDRSGAVKTFLNPIFSPYCPLLLIALELDVGKHDA
jgi:hypothetical protein